MHSARTVAQSDVTDLSLCSAVWSHEIPVAGAAWWTVPQAAQAQLCFLMVGGGPQWPVLPPACPV